MDEIFEAGALLLGRIRHELRNFFDLKIWIECDPDFGAKRGILRDGVNDFISWQKAYIPQEKIYVDFH